MREITIGKTAFAVKDYECSPDGEYLPKQKLSLWLYIELTDACPAACPFCVFAAQKGKGSRRIDPERLRETLAVVSPFVHGVSVTGGEPMTDIPLLEDAIGAIRDTIPPSVEVDMVTNGRHIEALPRVKGLERMTTVHVSRHAADDEVNSRLMGWPGAPTAEQLKNAFRELHDPGMTVLNCVLQKGGVHDRESVCEYLEMASGIGAANVSLISMFPANGYCERNCVSPEALEPEADPRFRVWNRFRDHEYCSCSTGDYAARTGLIRYYYRCPGKQAAPAYCRQLVYGADGVLRQGFGRSAEIVISEE